MITTRRLGAAVTVATLALAPLMPAAVAATEAVAAPAPGSSAEAPWEAQVEVAPGRAYAPVMTSAGHTFQATWWDDSARSRYAWKPFGGDWSRAKKLGMPEKQTGAFGFVGTGPNRVTHAWIEETDSGEWQHVTQWYDVDGRHGKARPAGDPVPGLAYDEIVLAASPAGALVISVVTGAGSVVVRDAHGRWVNFPPVPVPKFFATGAAIDDAGVATLIGFERDAESGFPIFAANSTAAGTWSVTQIGPRPGHSLGETQTVPMEIAAGANGDLLALWKEDDGTSLVAAHRSADPSADWQVDVLDDHFGCKCNLSAQAGTAANGDAAVLWTRPSDGAGPWDFDVLIARLDASAGQWSPPQTLGIERENAFLFGPLDDFVSVAATGDVVASYPQDDAQFAGREAFRCPADPSESCTRTGLLDGPAHRHEVWLRAGPDGTAVATWTSSCGDSCPSRRTSSQSIEPSQLAS